MFGAERLEQAEMGSRSSLSNAKVGAGNQGGFTYLWVLFLVALLGVGLSLAIDIGITATQRDKEKELLAIGRQFRMAIARYYEVQLPGGRKSYPVTLDDLLLDKRVPGTRRHLRKVFVDPMTGKAEWGLVKVGGMVVGVYSLSGQSPIKQDGFEADDAFFKGKGRYSDWKFTYPANALLSPEGVLKGAPGGMGGAGLSPSAIDPQSTVQGVPLAEVPAGTTASQPRASGEPAKTLWP